MLCRITMKLVVTSSSSLPECTNTKSIFFGENLRMFFFVSLGFQEEFLEEQTFVDYFNTFLALPVSMIALEPSCNTLPVQICTLTGMIKQAYCN